MRGLLWAVPLLLGQVSYPAVAAMDQDTLCASVFTYLSESARASGLASTGFDAAADRAQRAHLSLTPAEDPERYAVAVIDGAQSIREGLTRGMIDSSAVVNTATDCQSRYFVQNGVR